MRTLLLLRHAKSSWKNESLADHDRPLNKRGKKDAPRIGRLLKEEGLVPDVIIASTSKRTRMTAEAVAEACGYRNEVLYEEILYLASAGTLLQSAQQLPGPDHGKVMLIAHNPGMEHLVRLLSDEEHPFPTAALAAFELEVGDWRELELGIPTKLVGLWRPKELD